MKAVQYSDYVWNASLKVMPTLQNPNCCFSKLFGYYSCITVLPMLIQGMQWTSGCKNYYLVGQRLVKFTQLQIQSELVLH